MYSKEQAKEIMREFKKKNFGKAVKHGLNSSYQNYSCRCEECKVAHRLSNRKYYLKKGNEDAQVQPQS